MPKGPAARLGDPLTHPLPPVLSGGTGSVNVLIGGSPAWRALPAGLAASLQGPKKSGDAAIKTVEAASTAAAPTPGAGAAKAAENLTKTATAMAMSSLIMSTAASAAVGGGIVDIHSCATLLPIPPHGAGVVTDGSATVLINGLPACRMGDSILEAVGPPNKIAAGCPTVIIGG